MLETEPEEMLETEPEEMLETEPDEVLETPETEPEVMLDMGARGDARYGSQR